MMIAPSTYENLHKNDTYEELIKERDILISKIQYFEKNKDEIMANVQINPSPDVAYQMHLVYLATICLMIDRKFNPNMSNFKIIWQ